MSVQFNYELTKEGISKLNAQRNITKVHKKIVTEWLAKTKFLASRNAAEMQKGSKAGTYFKNKKLAGKKSGDMGRNVGIDMQPAGGGYVGSVGTGVGKTKSIKYARIQDEGGTTNPKVTDRMRKFAWAMFFANNTKKSKAIGAYMWLYLALTKKSTLTVKIPASKWFTGAVETNKPLLDEMMKPENVLRYANERMKMGGE